MADAIERGHESVAQSPTEKYSQAFFLDLATKGKDAWNAWRRDPTNKDVRVTFAGVDFSQAPKDQIDFSGFEFGDYADFSQCKWHCVGWPIGSSVSRSLIDSHIRAVGNPKPAIKDQRTEQPCAHPAHECRLPKWLGSVGNSILGHLFPYVRQSP